MGKIGMMVPRPDLDAPVAEHFAKASWLLVLDPPDRCDFVRNTAQDARALAEVLGSRGCTDVVARHMGPGAYAHITRAGIRVWHADERVTGRVVAQRLGGGALMPLVPERGEHERSHRHGRHRER